MRSFTQQDSWIRQMVESAPGDLYNCARYGIGAPRRYQRIYVNPVKIGYLLKDHDKYKENRLSGSVLSGDWDIRGVPITSTWAYQIVQRRIEENASWEDLGVYDRMMAAIVREGGEADACRTIYDVKWRYKALDSFIAHLQSGGRYLNRQEIKSKLFREYGGVVIHVGREELFFSGKGNHRLAVAKLLRLPLIPAQVGVVHVKAIESGLFRSLKSPNTTIAP